MLWANFPKWYDNWRGCSGKRDFARFEFKMRVGRISCTATIPKLSHTDSVVFQTDWMAEEVVVNNQQRCYCHININDLVTDCSISSALAMEILQSCTKPSIYTTNFRGLPYIITSPYPHTAGSTEHVYFWLIPWHNQCNLHNHKNLATFTSRSVVADIKIPQSVDPASLYRNLCSTASEIKVHSIPA